MPSPLRPGDPVAVVAPSSAPRDADRYRAGLRRLGATYDVRAAYTPRAPRGYLATGDGARARALNRALRNPDLHAVFCARGGYGALRILDAIDYDAAHAHPTWIVGYSDVTALHLALYAQTGLPGLSGPVVTEWAVMDDDTLGPFREIAEGRAAALGGPKGGPLRALTPGTACGPLLGGNLAVLTRLLGTPYFPDPDGAILFFEDVGEKPYQIDRMLAHLDLAGVLDAVAGVAVGQLSAPEMDPNTPTLTMREVLHDYFAHRPYPVALNLAYGHCLPRCTVPIGRTATLTVDGDVGELQVDGDAWDGDA